MGATGDLDVISEEFVINNPNRPKPVASDDEEDTNDETSGGPPRQATGRQQPSGRQQAGQQQVLRVCVSVSMLTSN